MNDIKQESEGSIKLVGLYELRKLWEGLNTLTPDESGNIHFNFERWKYVHDIAPDATVPE